MSLKLYTYWRSSCSWRVRICLAMKNLQYESIPIHLVKNGGEQHSESYKAINPIAQVPTLVDEGFELTQSMAIMEYLEEKYPTGGASLFPKDVQARARVRQVCEIINSGIQPVQNLNVLQRVGEGKAAWAEHYIARGFDALEPLLAKTSGKYCIGDELTAADACLVPQVMNAVRWGVDMANYPIISRINSSLLELEPFKVSDPKNQVDCPDNA